MGNTDIRSEELRIQGLLDRFLNYRKTTEVETDSHLDDDTLTAFVEGNLTYREATPVVGHLVDCSFCRHQTAELSRLELEFADSPVTENVAEAQPSKVSEILGGILTKIFGNSDAAVFAHEERKEEDAESNEKDAK